MDLKASNIYIGDDSKLILGDFGQAKFIVDGIIHNPPDLYPAIAPIEATTKKSIDKTADIYQFGLLLYSILCYDQYRHSIENDYKISTERLKVIYREKPDNVAELKIEFKESMKRFLSDIKAAQFPNRNQYPYFVPEKLQEIIHKCLEPIVGNRYNNFYQIQTDLNAFIFPKDVTALYQDLQTNCLHFNKEDKPCVISISKNGENYGISSKKNGRSPSEFQAENIKYKKLGKTLFDFITKI